MSSSNPNRKETILASARREFSERGYHSTCVSHIIQRAGIARGTFYLYFPGKRAVFDEVLGDIFRRILDQLQPVMVTTPWDGTSVVRQVRENAARLAGLFLDDRDTVRILVAQAVSLDQQANEQLAEFYGRLAQWVAESIMEGIRLHIVRPCNPLVTAYALIGSLKGILWGWVAGLVPLDKETFVKEAMALTLSGLFLLNKDGLPSSESPWLDLDDQSMAAK